MPELLNYNCCDGVIYTDEHDIWAAGILTTMLSLLNDQDRLLVSYSFSGNSLLANSVSRTITDMAYLFAILYLEEWYGDDALFDIQDLKDCIYERMKCKNIDISSLL